MTIDELIEELEVLRRKVQPSGLSPDAYRAVGWADRPLRMIIEQCREEQEAQLFRARHQSDFSGPEPQFRLPEPLPPEAMESSP